MSTDPRSRAWLEIDGERHQTTVGTPLRIKIA